ncbi:MAG: hypothetical protein ABMB14_29565 [Myxococcota bacterium]
MRRWWTCVWAAILVAGCDTSEALIGGGPSPIPMPQVAAAGIADPPGEPMTEVTEVAGAADDAPAELPPNGPDDGPAAAPPKAPVHHPPVATKLPPPPDPKAKRPKDAYSGLRFDLERDRRVLAYRRAAGQWVIDDAKVALESRLPPLIEFWKGTRWSYSGTTQVPKKGAIACGYFVSTVLQHAGFAVDRVDLARQASEQIVRTLVPDAEIRRFSRVSREGVAKEVQAMGTGVYLVGLDTHVGFLVSRKGESLKFCHSTSRNRRTGVVCDVAKTSPSFKSKYTVVGKLGDPVMLDAWVAGEKMTTARKNQTQADFLLAEAPLPRPPTFFTL